MEFFTALIDESFCEALIRTTLFLTIGFCLVEGVLHLFKLSSARVHQLCWFGVLLLGWTWIRPEIGESSTRSVSSVFSTLSHCGAASFLAALWCSGMLVIVLRAILRHRALVLSLRKDARDCDEQTREQWNKLLKFECLTQSISLQFSDRHGPMFVRGFGRCVLVLPEELWNSLEPQERSCLLHLHISHLRYRNSWRRFLARLLTLPHWFNPIAWKALRKFEQAMQRRCDETVALYSPDAIGHLKNVIQRLTQREKSDSASVEERLANLDQIQALAQKPAPLWKHVFALGSLSLFFLALSVQLHFEESEKTGITQEFVLYEPPKIVETKNPVSDKPSFETRYAALPDNVTAPSEEVFAPFAEPLVSEYVSPNLPYSFSDTMSDFADFTDFVISEEEESLFAAAIEMPSENVQSESVPEVIEEIVPEHVAEIELVHEPALAMPALLEDDELMPSELAMNDGGVMHDAPVPESAAVEESAAVAAKWGGGDLQKPSVPLAIQGEIPPESEEDFYEPAPREQFAEFYSPLLNPNFGKITLRNDLGAVVEDTAVLLLNEKLQSFLAEGDAKEVLEMIEAVPDKRTKYTLLVKLADELINMQAERHTLEPADEEQLFRVVNQVGEVLYRACETASEITTPIVRDNAYAALAERYGHYTAEFSLAREIIKRIRNPIFQSRHFDQLAELQKTNDPQNVAETRRLSKAAIVKALKRGNPVSTNQRESNNR